MSALDILAVVAIVGYVIGRQLLGEPLKGKRLILLPVILAVIGVTELAGHGHHPDATDIVMIVVGAVMAAGIGAAQGSMMRLESRAGGLWGQMPRRSLWLWLALVISHVVLAVVSAGLGAHVAASTAPLLLTLGVNRLAQAAVIAPRAMAAGIPFASEKDGSTFLAGVSAPGGQQPGTPPTPRARPGDTTTDRAWESGLRMITDWLAERHGRR
jgi:hypothetical protein